MAQEYKISVKEKGKHYPFDQIYQVDTSEDIPLKKLLVYSQEFTNYFGGSESKFGCLVEVFGVQKSNQKISLHDYLGVDEGEYNFNSRGVLKPLNLNPFPYSYCRYQFKIEHFINSGVRHRNLIFDISFLQRRKQFSRERYILGLPQGEFFALKVTPFYEDENTFDLVKMTQGKTYCFNERLCEEFQVN